MGFVPDHPFLYDRLTAWEFLDFVGALYRVGAMEVRARAETLLGRRPELVVVSSSVTLMLRTRRTTASAMAVPGKLVGTELSPTSKAAKTPEDGLRAMGRIYAGWALSQTFYRRELWRGLGFADLEDFLATLEHQRFRHEGDDIGLRDRLPFLDRQRSVFVCKLVKL